jgi:hypothetical protein
MWDYNDDGATNSVDVSHIQHVILDLAEMIPGKDYDINQNGS